jgi:CDP-6-deoxy-D-xylo-4-hexulose-3-dehydrase
MQSNVNSQDIKVLVDFLQQDPAPRLTQSEQVRELEKQWSEWLGVKHSVYVNSGASANLLSISALKYTHGATGEIVVPAFTWVSDISSVILNGFTPVFIDIDLDTLGMNEEQLLDSINDNTRAVFITYAQGFNCLTERILDELEKRNIPLIEDVCESHGATFNGKKLGSFGLSSNFSFYFAHHMTTVEGGMICTNNNELYQLLRLLRSHGMLREADDEKFIEKQEKLFPEIDLDFNFLYPGYNVRGTELGAVLGINQLKRLDSNNMIRMKNLELFLSLLDKNKYFTDFKVEGNCNYALPVILKEADSKQKQILENNLTNEKIEFRRGSVGGNQLRQPYLRDYITSGQWEEYPVVEHIHFFGYYIGNHGELKEEDIRFLANTVNNQ